MANFAGLLAGLAGLPQGYQQAQQEQQQRQWRALQMQAAQQEMQAQQRQQQAANIYYQSVLGMPGAGGGQAPPVGQQIPQQMGPTGAVGQAPLPRQPTQQQAQPHTAPACAQGPQQTGLQPQRPQALPFPTQVRSGWVRRPPYKNISQPAGPSPGGAAMGAGRPSGYRAAAAGAPPAAQWGIPPVKLATWTRPGRLSRSEPRARRRGEVSIMLGDTTLRRSRKRGLRPSSSPLRSMTRRKREGRPGASMI